MKGINKLSAEERSDALNGLEQVKEVIALLEGKMRWRGLKGLWAQWQRTGVRVIVWTLQSILWIWLGWKVGLWLVAGLIVFNMVVGLHTRARRKVVADTRAHFWALYEQDIPTEFIEKIWQGKV